MPRSVSANDISRKSPFNLFTPLDMLFPESAHTKKETDVLSKEDIFMIKQMCQQDVYIVDIANQMGCSERIIRRYPITPTCISVLNYSNGNEKNSLL